MNIFKIITTVIQKDILFILTLLIVLPACNTRQGMLPFKERNKYGFKSFNGKIKIKPQYDGLGWGFVNGFKNVQKNGKWGTINEKGKLIIPIKYDYIDYFSEEGIASAKLNGHIGFIDKTGKEIIPFIYEDTWGFHNGIAKVKKNNLWGYIDKKGEIIIPIEYDDFDFDNWSEGLIGACKNHKWGFIDLNNKIVIPFDYYRVNSFSEGLASVAKSYGQWGYIDHNNSIIIPLIYEDPINVDYYSSKFRNGIVQVSLNGKSGYINKSGEVIIPIKYYNLKRFCKGYAYAEIDNGEKIFSDKHKILQSGYVDSTGKEYLYYYRDFNKFKWQIISAPKEIPDSSHLLKSFDTTLTRPWTLEKLLAQGLSALRSEPTTYPDLCKLNQLCIAYGLMIGCGNFSEDFMSPDWDAWEVFKKYTIYKIISSETLRQITWNWVAPYYKVSFQSTNPFVQNTYKEIAFYIKNYINTYDKKKVIAYLKRDERKFAHYDMNGNFDPNRKLSAFVDRLIIIHNVLTVEDAKIWINKVADEVLKW